MVEENWNVRGVKRGKKKHWLRVLSFFRCAEVVLQTMRTIQSHTH